MSMTDTEVIAQAKRLNSTCLRCGGSIDYNDLSGADGAVPDRLFAVKLRMPDAIAHRRCYTDHGIALD